MEEGVVRLENRSRFQVLLYVGVEMTANDGHELTRLLQAWAGNDVEALEQLAPMVQAVLQRLARAYMAGERRNHPLQTTALINEAYIRLIGWKDVRWQNRAHFFAVAAQL